MGRVLGRTAELRASEAKYRALIEFAPHDLRRTYARLLHDAGVRVVAIQQNLGHATLETTLRYVGNLETELRKPPSILRPNMRWLKG